MNNSWIRWTAIAGMLITAPVAFNPMAVGQEDSCFLRTASGRTINLDKLCGGGTIQPKTSAPSSSTSVAPQKLYQARIKYRLGRTPVIAVTFNNGQTFDMIVDTGADATLITRNMAQALRVPLIATGLFEMADGRTVAMPVGRIQSMSVNGAEIRNTNVVISEQIGVGLLGHDFFEHYDVKIKQNVVEFYPRS